MLVKKVVYNHMTVDQLDKQIDKIKVKLENETDSEKKLKYYEEVTIIMGALIKKIKHNKTLVGYVHQSLNELKTKCEKKAKESK